MSKLVALYVRVSSKQQDQRSQEPDLRRWVASQEGETAWYRDTFTGRSMNRPGMDRLMADIQAGKVGAVVVWRLDRLGRTAKGLTALFEELRERGVRLISLKDGLDLATPAGRLMANMLASVAAYETEIRAERVLAGQAAARARGQRWGGSLRGRLISVTKEQIAMAQQMKAQGAAITVIARATGLCRSTIYRLLNAQNNGIKRPTDSKEHSLALTSL